MAILTKAYRSDRGNLDTLAFGVLVHGVQCEEDAVHGGLVTEPPAARDVIAALDDWGLHLACAVGRVDREELGNEVCARLAAMFDLSPRDLYRGIYTEVTDPEEPIDMMRTP